jgi:phosphatidylglycerophosphate synthase
VSTAVLLATAPDSARGPAAGLGWQDTTLLGRLIEQLAELGVQEFHVVTRPAWAGELGSSLARSAVAVRVHASEDRPADLRAVAAIAGEGGNGALVVANADILTQREALAGLLADPRVGTGVLVTTRQISRVTAFRTRARRGVVTAASTPYHLVREPNRTFLGVLKLDARDRAAAAHVAERLAELLDGPLPEAWADEFEAKAARWKLTLHRHGADHGVRRQATEETFEDDTASEPAGDVELSPEEEAELRRRLGAAEQDVTALLLYGLTRSAMRVSTRHLRRLFWARPLSPEDLDRAAARIAEHDEDRALLDSAVKASDGFFTTFFVSPYSKYIARWAARRGWSPNGVTTLSAAIGFAAAAAFATGERWGMIAGAILLQAAFTFDCVDGQLARYTRTFTRFGAWLDSIFDRTKEYAVFAGLAIGASRSGEDVWLLAGAALTLQVLRHSIDFSYPQTEHQATGAVRHPPLEDVLGAASRAPRKAADAPAPTAAAPSRPTLRRRVRGVLRAVDRSRRGRWLKKIAGFPIGERFAAISVGAALFDARTTFLVLLAWGGFAALYTIAGRVLRSLGRRGPAVSDQAAVAGAGTLVAYRDDGPLALALGRLPLPPLPASALVLAGVGVLLGVVAITGDGASWPLAGATLAAVIAAGGVSAGRPLLDRMRWAVPPALRVAEYAGILWVAALAGGSAVPGAFALLLAVTFRHYDTVYRLRHREASPPRWLNRAAGGWDGRVLACYVLAAAAAVPAGFYAAGALLGIAFVGEAIAGWATFERSEQPDVYDDEEEDAE